MKYLSADAVSKKYNLKLEEVNRLCVFRKIIGKRLGEEWFVDEISVKEYLTNPDPTILNLDRETTQPLVKLFSALGLIIILGFILTPKNFQALVAGEQLVAQTVAERGSTATFQAFDGVVARTAEFGASGREAFFQTKEFFQNLGPISQDNYKYFTQKISNNWATFLSGNNGEASVAVAGFSEQTREALKQEITAELRQELLGSFGGGQIPPAQITPANRGLVVVPSTGNEVSDTELKNNLQNVFSDQVRVSFDASGQAGIITPIFRGTAGTNYLFILAPIKQ
ncbi:MAG: hypothetical protein AAB453_04630 [Patescibacteria group bacterium]